MPPVLLVWDGAYKNEGQAIYLPNFFYKRATINKLGQSIG
jgi:hypothetical protein